MRILTIDATIRSLFLLLQIVCRKHAKPPWLFFNLLILDILIEYLIAMVGFIGSVTYAT